MNQKKAKSLRRAVKGTFGHDAREVKYADTPFGQRVIRDGHHRDGTPKIRIFSISGTTILLKDCGRAQYQKLKRAYKKARHSGLNPVFPAHHVYQ